MIKESRINHQEAILNETLSDYCDEKRFFFAVKKIAGVKIVQVFEVYVGKEKQTYQKIIYSLPYYTFDKIDKLISLSSRSFKKGTEAIHISFSTVLTYLSLMLVVEHYNKERKRCADTMKDFEELISNGADTFVSKGAYEYNSKDAVEKRFEKQVLAVKSASENVLFEIFKYLSYHYENLSDFFDSSIDLKSYYEHAVKLVLDIDYEYGDC